MMNGYQNLNHLTMSKTTTNIQGQPTNSDRSRKRIFKDLIRDKSLYTYVKVEGYGVNTWKEVRIINNDKK